jgi:hypothetical protein
MCAAEDRGSLSRIAPSQPHGQRHERVFIQRAICTCVEGIVVGGLAPEQHRTGEASVRATHEPNFCDLTSKGVTSLIKGVRGRSMWFVTKNSQHSEVSGAEEPSFKPVDYTLLPWVARATRKPGGRFKSAIGRRPLPLRQRQRSARHGRRDWRCGIVGLVTLNSALHPAIGGRVRRSYVPWLLAALLVIGLLPACSSGTNKKPAASSGGIPLVSKDVGPSGMTVHFQGGWINVPAGAVAQRQTLHIRTAPPLPSAPALSAKLS